MMGASILMSFMSDGSVVMRWCAVVLATFAANQVGQLVACLLRSGAATLEHVHANGEEEANGKDEHDALCSNSESSAHGWHVDFHKVKSRIVLIYDLHGTRIFGGCRLGRHQVPHDCEHSV